MSLFIGNTNSQRVAVSGSPALINMGTGPKRVRVFSDRNIHVAVGINPTAAEANSMPVAERAEVFLTVPSAHSISVITAAGEPSGFVWVTEV